MSEISPPTPLPNAGLTTWGTLIVALDITERDAIDHLVSHLGSTVMFYKVGPQALLHTGPSLIADLKDRGKGVFLDLKFLDIGSTVEKAVRAAASLGVDAVTVHAERQALAAAVAASRQVRGPHIIGVSVMTSWRETDVQASGYAIDREALFARRVTTIAECGAHGVVCAAKAVPRARAIIANANQNTAARKNAPSAPRVPECQVFLTPGIRNAQDNHHDQIQTADAREAITLGATHIVVGRPIHAAPCPKTAAESILEQIA